MPGDAGYWPPGGQRRADHGDYLDEDDLDQLPGYHGRDEYRGSGGHGQPGYEADGFARRGELERPSGYGEPDHYRDGAYGESSGYGNRPGYGDPADYGDQPGYGDPAGQRGYGGQDGGYGSQNGYGDPSGYGDPGGYGEPSGYRDRAGYDDHRDYGAREAERGRHSGGSAASAPGHDSTDPYGDAAYGTESGGSPYATGSYRQEPGYAIDPYDPLGGSWASSARRREEPGPGEPSSAPGYLPSGQYSRPDLSSAGRYEPDGYLDTGSLNGAGPDYLGSDPLGLAGTGSFDAAEGSPGRADGDSRSGWAFRPDAASYGSGALGDPGTGSFPRADSESFARPDSGSFARPDSGSFARPDSGSFARPDSGSFARPDSGSFARPDSGSFGRPDTGSFEQGYSTGSRHLESVPSSRDDMDDDSASLDSDIHDTGSIRWTAGPPPLKTRADRNREDAGLAGPPSGGPDGYAEWHHDPADNYWPDDEGGGLLSRRFGRGGGDDPPGGRRGGRSKNRGRKRRRFRGKAASTLAILAVVFVLGAATFVGYKYVNGVISNRYGDYSGAGHGVVEVTVPQGASLVGLGPLLVRKGVIMAVRPFDSAAAAANGNALQPGLYKLHLHMNAALAVHWLLDPKTRVKDQVTIIEGSRAQTIADQFAAQTGRSASAFMQIIKHPPATLGLPNWAGPTAEGFLFPDTYTLTPKETPLQILQAMVAEFNTKVAGISLATEASKVFTTPWHVLIVASMVQAEGGRLQDFGGIARVAWNRLKANMALQFDSTVFYAKGTHGTAITQQDEKYPSPYNTYLHKGLPPGPIGNPGIDAIKAALHPASGDWLYFITDTRPKHPPYKTYFTNSLTKLQQWQQQFQN